MAQSYKFKEITVVPTAKDFVDIVLSKTQRKTPTQVHPQFKISRIRSFYMRKVKFCQQAFHDRLSSILQEFPKLDDLHPFYADLCNVLYDRDHYKVGLGQVHAVRAIIDNVAKDYVRLLKYADSPYKCKMLKRAALGRMCTAVKKLHASLAYLEEVRQHLARLPSINPTTRTLILTGFPNVGKSSFMNQVTNANVEVQPYAFTTKSLYVGHFDYHYTRWQVIDTPGILDHPLEERNTIEMTAITALANIQATVLYFVDLSEQCGFRLDAQVALFHSLKPLFRNKPLLVILNKMDVRPPDALEPDERALIESMKEGGGVEFLPTSCLTAQGVDNAKNKACELLLTRRVQGKVESKKVDSVLNRLHVTAVEPRADRPPCIPDSVQQQRQMKQMGMEMPKRRTEKDLQEEQGGPGVYSVDLKKQYMLQDDSWKYDLVPEIFEGKNVADFIDPDIEARLTELEKEEALLIQSGADDVLDEEDWRHTQQLLKEVHSKIQQKRVENALTKSRNHVPTPRQRGSGIGVSEVESHLTDIGLDASVVRRRARKTPHALSSGHGEGRTMQEGGHRKRTRSDAEMDIDDEEGAEDVKMAVDQEESERRPGKKRRLSSPSDMTGKDTNPHAKKNAPDRVKTGLPKEKVHSRRSGNASHHAYALCFSG